MKFKLAETKEELEAAFKLLHDAYVSSGFMEKHPSGMRITPYHALPSTSTLIATHDGEVIGTISIVRESSFGFPLESIFNVDEYKNHGSRIAEISSLAIRKDYRNNSGDVLWPLIKFAYEYCIKYFGVDFMLIAVNPNRIDFYESLLMFDLLNNGRPYKYPFVKNAKAVGGILDLRYSYQLWASKYLHKKPAKNIFMYFTQISFENFKFPDRKYFKISDPVMTPEMLEYFFNEQSDVFHDLSKEQMLSIAKQYDLNLYGDVLGHRAADYLREQRAERRFDTQCKARMHIPSSDRIIKMQILDASLSGFRARLEHSVRFGNPYRINIAVGEFDIADVIAFPAWKADDHSFGFVIEESSENWRAFIAYLEESKDEPDCKILPINN